MTQFLGRLRTPQLPSAPSSPVKGEMYMDTATNILYWWNGTTWVGAGGGGADLAYNGDFVPASGYTDGDIVVAEDGVAYLCVEPTSDEPQPWPSTAVPAGAELTYEGDYVPATAYVDGDIAVYDGKAWLCVTPTNTPPDPWPGGATPSNLVYKAGYGTTLPASPADGQEHVLVDSVTNPTYQWRFRYNADSTSAYKWEFIGGPVKNVFAGSGVYAGVPTASWTNSGAVLFYVPRAGDYSVSGAAQFTCPTVGAYVNFAFGVNGGVAGSIQRTISVDGAGHHFLAAGMDLLTGVPAGGFVSHMYYATHANTQFANKALTVQPVRVA